jgi:hypothetical protein
MLKTWGAGEKVKVDALLTTHHRIIVSVQLLDLSHRYVGDLTGRLLSGQVDVDATAQEATRQATLEILDPLYQLQLDSSAPDDGSVFYTRMVKVIYTIVSTDGKQQWSFPLFTGPIAKVERNGPIISITAIGKDKLAMSQVWKAKTYKKGHKKTWVIADILVNVAGEAVNKIYVPDRKEKAGKVVINKDTTAWKAAKKLASSLGAGFQLFYDGRGVVKLRRISNSTIYVFRSQGALLSWPQVSYDTENIINAVQVVGGKPKGKKTKVQYRIVAPRNHPLSPWSMGRNNTPRYLPEVIENESIKSKKKARALAKARLRNALLEQVEVTFESLPIPYLEEGDKVRVSSDQFSGSFRVKKFSIPLTADGTMSIGYLKRVTPSKRFLKIRTPKKKKRQPNR